MFLTRVKLILRITMGILLIILGSIMMLYESPIPKEQRRLLVNPPECLPLFFYDKTTGKTVHGKICGL